MRSVILTALIACSTLTAHSQGSRSIKNDRVTIARKQIVIVRSGKFVTDFPDRKRATINYPTISGLYNAAVLRKVRALLSFNRVFDTSLQWYRESNWLDKLDYIVNYNENYILDLTFTQNGVAAYPDSQSKTISIDLRKGKVIKARDLFLSQKLPELASLVNEMLQAEVAESIQAVRADRQLGDASSIIEALQEMEFEVNDLDGLSISSKGVTFLYDVGFPHVHAAFEPVGRYLIKYPDLKSFVRPHSILEPILRRQQD